MSSRPPLTAEALRSRRRDDSLSDDGSGSVTEEEEEMTVPAAGPSRSPMPAQTPRDASAELRQHHAHRASSLAAPAFAHDPTLAPAMARAPSSSSMTLAWPARSVTSTSAGAVNGSSRAGSEPGSETEEEEEEGDTPEELRPIMPPRRMAPRREGPLFLRTPSPELARQEAIVISSSDEEEQGGSNNNNVLPRRVRGQGRRFGADANADADPDASFVIERVVRRRPPTIELGEDDDDDGGGGGGGGGIGDDDEREMMFNAHQHATAAATPTARNPAATTNLRITPPRTKPPPLAYPLVNTFTCPICFCAPDDAVTTPCGHVFCSQCLFEALKVPLAAQPAALRLANAAAAGYSRRGAGGNGMNPSWLRSGGRGRGRGGNRGRGRGRGRGAAAAARAGATAGTAVDIANLDDDDDDDDADGVESGDATTAAAGTYDPLTGPCPNCRAPIPGGFIQRSLVHRLMTRPAKHRGVFGLIFKTGKPIDDPRRSEAAERQQRERQQRESGGGGSGGGGGGERDGQQQAEDAEAAV